MEIDDRLTIYEAVGGEEGVRSIVESFYPKVQENPLLGPLFPEDIAPVMEKQVLFLTQFFGGPPLYTQQYGHPMMRARHMAFPVTAERAQAWLGCMRKALDETVEDPDLRLAILERLKAPAYHFVNS